jgi:RNA polymerase sigma-70 factor (ECF subfamily)
VQLEAHLFRREAGRILGALTRLFGLQNLELAEDVVQDALCRALEVWNLRGVPDNPSAWLMTTAKHRALDVLRRERTARTFAPEVARHIETTAALATHVDDCFEPTAIRDEQLRMMFSCCAPQLAEEAQVALVLSVLCGFSVGEIAQAFLASEAAVKKRITRAKKVLAGAPDALDLAPDVVAARLPAVHRALYLLFNEGFHGAGAESAIRVDLCRDAMRLVALLLEHPVTATAATRALLALMCLCAARLPARLDASGNLHPLFEQDRSLWDRALIAEGQRLLDQAATGTELTEYHVEAAIAWAHCSAARPEDTSWDTIVTLYDLLLRHWPSPVVALQRAIAIAELHGPERGLWELAAIADRDRLASYPFYTAALAELELRSGRTRLALGHFRNALALARNPTERRFFEARIRACEETLPGSD